MHHSTPHQAHYDSAGNIVIDDSTSMKKEAHTEAASVKSPEVLNDLPYASHGVWRIEERDSRTETKRTVTPATTQVHTPVQREETETPKASLFSKVSVHAQTISGSAVNEGKKQLKETLKDAEVGMKELRTHLEKIPKRSKGFLQKIWKKATQPIVVKGAKAGRKSRSKIRLFIIDTIRFGGTFALIFGVLFSAINYQSFYQIAKAELALGGDLENEKALQNMVDSGAPSEFTKLQGTIGATRNVRNLTAFLSPVGPPEDRLVIPKLGKNVPIVRPNMDALMREDWVTFEKDIQESLKQGVVHYPGSAKPGNPGNFFLTGHSSHYPWVTSKYKDVFARLGELGVGDTYSVYYGGDRHNYRIIEKKEVRPNNVSVLDQPTNKRLATLMTCTPVGTTLRRLILVAEEIDSRTNQALAVGQKLADAPSRAVKLQALPM